MLAAHQLCGHRDKVPITAHYLEPVDAAICKLARGKPRDLGWVTAFRRKRSLRRQPAAVDYALASTALPDLPNRKKCPLPLGIPCRIDRSDSIVAVAFNSLNTNFFYIASTLKNTAYA